MAFVAERKREEVRNKLIKKEWGLADEKKKKKKRELMQVVLWNCVLKLKINKVAFLKG